jgi:quinol monooxygenase YgiN
MYGAAICACSQCVDSTASLSSFFNAFCAINALIQIVVNHCALGQEGAEATRKVVAERKKAQRLQEFALAVEKLRAEPGNMMLQEAVTGAIALHTDYPALAAHMANERFVAAVSVLDCSTPEAMIASRAIENQAADSEYQVRKSEANGVVVSFLLRDT